MLKLNLKFSEELWNLHAEHCFKSPQALPDTIVSADISCKFEKRDKMSVLTISVTTVVPNFFFLERNKVRYFCQRMTSY